MKFVSWNVNGLRACAGKGFADAFNSLDADFFCLQETKMQPGQLDMEFEGYKSYWNSAEKKGYSGTAVYARREQPLGSPARRPRRQPRRRPAPPAAASGRRGGAWRPDARSAIRRQHQPPPRP